jgi:hypothetical protein
MNEKKPAGRPRNDGPPRDFEVRFFLTRKDADWWDALAKAMKFRGRSHLFTVMIERIKLGGLAPAAFLVLGLMLSKRIDNLKARNPKAGFFNPLKGLPPLPDPEEPAAEEIKQAALHIAENAETTLQRV